LYLSWTDVTINSATRAVWSLKTLIYTCLWHFWTCLESSRNDKPGGRPVHFSAIHFPAHPFFRRGPWAKIRPRAETPRHGGMSRWRRPGLRDKPRGAVQLCSKSKRSQYFRFFRTRFFKICYLCDVCKSWKLVQVHWVRKVGYVWKISLHASLQFSWATFSFQSLRLKRTQN